MSLRYENCLVRFRATRDIETNAEIGTQAADKGRRRRHRSALFRLVWPIEDDGLLVSIPTPSPSAERVFPRISRAIVSEGTNVTLDLSTLNYLEIRRLAHQIATTDHPQRMVYTCHGREVYDSQSGADPEHLFATLLTRSDIMDLQPGPYRRQAAMHQLKILREFGWALERDECTNEELHAIQTLDPNFDQSSSLAEKLRLMGWLQPDGQMLGVARCWALGALDA